MNMDEMKNKAKDKADDFMGDDKDKNMQNRKNPKDFTDERRNSENSM